MGSEFIFVEELVNIVNCLFICIKVEAASNWLLGLIILVIVIVVVAVLLVVIRVLLLSTIVVVIIILVSGSVCSWWTRELWDALSWRTLGRIFFV